MIAGPLRDIVATTVWWDARNGLMVVMIVSKFMHILKVCLSITQKITIEKKQKLFTSMPNLQLVTVSKWLEGEVRKSFFKESSVYNDL